MPIDSQLAATIDVTAERFTAVAIAAASGFAAATVVTPSRDQSFKEKWSRMTDSMQAWAASASMAGGTAQTVANQHPGLTAVVASFLIDLVRVAVQKVYRRIDAGA